MNWRNERVLVTGAAGFIGSHLVEKLVAAGANVKAFVHYNSQGTCGWLDHSSVFKDIAVITGDIADGDSVRRAVKGTTTVFHLAALIGIPYSYNAPASYVRTNIEGTLNVLQAALAAEVQTVVHTSTSEVYGTARYVPIDELHPLQGQSPYSASKIGADKLVESFHLSFGLPVVTVRPFNTFGPRQSARAIVPSIITQALVGSVIRVGNLLPTRDLTYVQDTAEAFMLAALTPESRGQTINIGSGSQISIGDLTHLIAQIVGEPLELEIDEKRVRPTGSEVDRLLADNTKAQALLGWTPTVSLEDGLVRTIEWLERHLNRYRPSVYAI